MTAHNKDTHLRIGGEAGQGVILAGVILAEAALRDKRQVAQSARYGAAVRGGEATADVVISDHSIDYPHVEAPDCLVVLSQQTYDRFVPLQQKDTTVIYDPFFVEPAQWDGVRQLEIAATDKAIKRFGKGTASNLIILGFLAELTSMVTMDSLVGAVKESVPAKFKEDNLEAVSMGREIAREVAR